MGKRKEHIHPYTEELSLVLLFIAITTFMLHFYDIYIDPNNSFYLVFCYLLVCFCVVFLTILLKKDHKPYKP
jgi:Ca2+/Na+ antiporter